MCIFTSIVVSLLEKLFNFPPFILLHRARRKRSFSSQPQPIPHFYQSIVLIDLINREKMQLHRISTFNALLSKRFTSVLCSKCKNYEYVMIRISTFRKHICRSPPTKIQSLMHLRRRWGVDINLEQTLRQPPSPSASDANEDASVKLPNRAIGAKSGSAVFLTEIGMIRWQHGGEWFIKNATEKENVKHSGFKFYNTSLR